MDKRHAKEILTACRAGGIDDVDPEVAEALAQARQDPELGSWLEQHLAWQATVRRGFREILVPADLKDRILAQAKVRRTGIGWARREYLAAAAAAAVLLVSWILFRPGPPATSAFAVYSHRMVRAVLRNYRMDLETRDSGQIRQFLARHRAIADYDLTKPLGRLPGIGCAVLHWHGHPVSMVCLDAGGRNPLYFFVIRRAGLDNAPRSITPQLRRIGPLMTAGWSSGDNTYLLAGHGDEQFLRRFL